MVTCTLPNSSNPITNGNVAGTTMQYGTIGYQHPQYGLQGAIITSKDSIDLPEGLTELNLILQEDSTGVSIGVVTIGDGVKVIIPETSKWYFYG